MEEPVLSVRLLAPLSTEGKSRYAELLREDGNRLYKEGKWAEAIDFYSAGLKIKVDHLLYSNRAACYMNTEEYENVIEDTTAALRLKPDFTKCIERRAKAYRALHDRDTKILETLGERDVKHDVSNATAREYGTIEEAEVSKEVSKRFNEADLKSSPAQSAEDPTPSQSETLHIASHKAVEVILSNSFSAPPVSVPKADENEQKKRKEKKQSKKSKPPVETTSEPVSKSSHNLYPVDEGGLPSITEAQVRKLSAQDKGKIALAIKADGNRFYAEKKYEKAIKCYSVALLCKKDKVFFSNRSICYLALKDYDMTIKDCDAAIAIDKNYSKCYLRRAEAYGSKKEYYKALMDISYVRSYLQNDSFSTVTKYETLIKKHAESIVAERINTDHPYPAAAGIRTIWQRLNPENSILGESIDSFENVEGDHYLVEALKLISSGKFSSGEQLEGLFTRAMEWYSRELEAFDLDNPFVDTDMFFDLRNKKAITLEYYAMLMHLRGYEDKPKQLLNEAEELLPDRERIHIARAIIHHRKGRLWEATEILQEALDINPDSHSAHWNLAKVYLSYHSFELAFKECKTAIRIDPENFWVYTLLGDVLCNAGNFEGADKHLRDTLQKFPEQPAVFASYGTFLNTYGKPEAKKYMLKAHELQLKSDVITSGGTSMSELALGALEMFKDRSTSASISREIEEYAQASLDIDPSTPLALFALGQLTFFSGQPKQGLRMCEQSTMKCLSHEDRVEQTIFTEELRIQVETAAKMLNIPVL